MALLYKAVKGGHSTNCWRSAFIPWCSREINLIPLEILLNIKWHLMRLSCCHGTFHLTYMIPPGVPPGLYYLWDVPLDPNGTSQGIAWDLMGRPVVKPGNVTAKITPDQLK